jgi:hypothetical protein
MTAGATGRRQNPPPAARSASTLSLSTSLATGASAGSPSQGGRSCRRVGGQEPVAPPTASEGPPGKAGPLRLGGTRPMGATRGRTVRWPSRAGRAAGRELEPTFLSRTAVSGCRDDDTSVAWRGDDEDDPGISLQSTAALARLPLHDGSVDRSSLEETPCSPAFRLLMRLSFRSRLAISRRLCCALREACRLSVAALFWLKIASSGRGALAGTRCAHFNCNDKKAEKSFGAEGL